MLNSLKSYFWPNISKYEHNCYFMGTFGKITYQKYGSGPKFVICLHSFSGNSNEFEAIAKTFADNNYNVICPNFYGRGGSEAVEMKYNLNLFCSQINDVLLHFKCIFPVTLLGFSMGGMIAHYFSNRYPNIVKDLILLAPTGQNTYIPMYLDYYVFYPLGEIIASIASRFFLNQHKQNMGGNKVYTLNQKYLRSLLLTLRNIPWNDYNFKKLKCNTLLIYSESDKLVEVNPDTICHNESYVFSEYSHLDLLKSKIADIILKSI